MLELWSSATRHGLWRRLWLALAEAQRELGVAIPEDAIRQMRANLDKIDFDAVAAYEKRFRHDVMAHIHSFGDVAPKAKPFIHLGATSAYVTDNADLILMRRGLDLLRGRVLDVLRSLAAFAEKWRNQPTLGYTHLQPAQLTTVGKRATLWMQDLVLDIEEIDYRRRTLPFRGVKGTTGTQASFLELFQGNHEKVRRLDRLVSEKMSFPAPLPVSGQTYTRKLDAFVLSVVAGAERISSLARFVNSLEGNANETHSVQYFERTLDDSANRRIVIPEMFLATDAIMVLMANIASGLEVHTAVIERRIAAELPFMATEELIVRAVRGGGDRQLAHETIRKHSLAAARALKNGAEANDLLERLSKDKSFGVKLKDLQGAIDPQRFVGRAPEQVDEFLRDVITPLFAGETAKSERLEELRV